MQKFREYKACPCEQCQHGSKKKRKTQAHRLFRQAVKRTLRRSMTPWAWDWHLDPDWECGPVAAGRWD